MIPFGHMRLRESYDWVVLGDHPGALLSAAIAARLGLSVLVLPSSDSMKVVVSKSSQCLDPETNLVLGLGQAQRVNGLLWDSLGRLGISRSEKERIIQSEIVAQIVTPTRRVSLPLDDDSFARELRREFGGPGTSASGLPGALARSEEPILNFWREFPENFNLEGGRAPRPRGGGVESVSRMQLRKTLLQANRSRPKAEQAWFQESQGLGALVRSTGEADWKEVCEGLWYGLSLNEGATIELSELIHMVAVSRTAAGVRGGLTAYREMLRMIAKRLGADVRDETSCRRIFVEDGRFTGVQAANSGNKIEARGGVLGFSLDRTASFLSVTGRAWSRKLKSSPVPSGWKFTLALTVHAESVPPGLVNHTIWKEDAAPAIEVEIADPADYAINGRNQKLLFLRTLLPFREESLSADYQRMAAARMLRLLSDLVPYLEYHVIRIYPDFRGSNEEFKEAYPFPSLQAVPENLRAVSRNGVGSRSGVEGLFVATGESFPELGTLGPTVAALEAVSWIAHRCGLPGPFA